MIKKWKLVSLIMISILVCSIFLTGCDDSDWEYLFWGLMVWGEEHNVIVNEEFQPGALAALVAKDATDDWMNTLESVQLDGLGVVHEIEKANELSDQALAELDSSKIREAIAIRPNDWVLHEKDAIIWAAYHNGAAADAAILQSDTLLKESLRPGDSCIAARQSQLNQRMSLLWEEIKRQESGNAEGNTANELREMYEAAAREYKENEKNMTTDFCEGFGQ